MKMLITALYVLLCACGSLQVHAEVVSAAAPVIDAVGQAIESEAALDVEKARAQGGDVAARIAKLQQSYAPIERAYEEARAAHEAYVKAILTAVQHGDRALGAGYAVRMLDAWHSAERAGEAIGVSVPAPPRMLERLAEEE